MKVLNGMFAVFLLTACLSACCNNHGATGMVSDAKVSRALGSSTMLSAKIVAVNAQTRELTLQGEDGRVTTITAGPEVRNFAQIEAGDKVSITFIEALAYDVVKPETATPEGIQTAEATARAKLGEKPGAGAVTSSVFTATIEGIDLLNDRVTLRGPSGDPVTFKVREPKNLRKVAVGDKVVITYDRALAISVEKDS